jgi:hypothetical protein
LQSLPLLPIVSIVQGDGKEFFSSLLNIGSNCLLLYAMLTLAYNALVTILALQMQQHVQPT